MRDLDNEDIKKELGVGQWEDGKGIVATIGELADAEFGTYCGGFENKAFSALKDKFGDRMIVGEVTPDKKVVGMVFVQCDEQEGEEIDDLVQDNDGSLRFDYAESKYLPGYRLFEIE